MFERRYANLLSAIPLLLLALALASAIAGAVQREGFFGADDLYAPALVTDLSSWSGQLRDWRLTPAPYVFPDLLLYAAVHAFAPSIELAQYASGLLQLWLFAWLALLLVSRVVAQRALAAASCALVLLPALLLHITRVVELPGLTPLFRPTNHGGAALAALLVLSLCFGRERAVWGGGVSLLAGVSDPLFAASCAVPLLALAVASLVGPVWRWWTAGVVVSRTSLWVASLAGLAGAALTDPLHRRLANELRGIALAPTRERAWQGLLHDLFEVQPALGVELAVLLVACAALLSSRRLRMLATWLAASIVSTVLAMIWTRNYLDAGSLRYLTVPFAVAPVFAAATLAASIAGPIRERFVAAVAALMVATLCGAGVMCTPVLARGQFRSSWREQVSCVERVLQREDVDVILTDYWRAKPLLLFSNGRIRALQMRSKLRRPYFWISSRGWYRGEHRFGVVAVNALRPDAIVRAYGEPAQIDRCGENELFSFRGAARAKLAANMNRLIRGFLADPSPP